ncbi:MAG: hypothetical protein R3D98_02485 [Candidatus Krumholzibacteriia bacterium]
MRFQMGLIALAIVLAGCGRGDRETAAHERQVSGQFASGDATLHYVATFRDSALVKLEEQQDFGDLGEARAVYEVVDGRLAYYRSDESRARAGDGPTGRERVQMELEFDAAGRVIGQHKFVDGSPAELLGYEAPGVQRHFEGLSRRAAAEEAVARAGMR